MTAMPSPLNQLYTYSRINILSVKALIIQCPQPRSLPHIDYNVFQTLSKCTSSKKTFLVTALFWNTFRFMYSLKYIHLYFLSHSDLHFENSSPAKAMAFWSLYLLEDSIPTCWRVWPSPLHETEVSITQYNSEKSLKSNANLATCHTY